ncbi:MAG: hypothetical protein M3010_00770 [Candidatus Dormibacteraeota bacterium]|nr:hypothetical protein [Candidatus Dormibacteraeota bacterium]
MSAFPQPAFPRFFLSAVGAPAAEVATSGTTLVSGFEFYATHTEGRFTGTASGEGPSGLSGAWSIAVDHTPLDPCVSASLQPCAQVTGGTFTLAVTSPSPQLITGTFDAQDPGVDGITLLESGPNCTTQLFRIKDGLSNVGTGGQATGTGSFVGYLWHHRTGIFGSCVTYSATVQGTVVLNF